MEKANKKETNIWGGDSPENTIDCPICKVNLYGKDLVSVQIVPKNEGTQRCFDICRKCFITCNRKEIETAAEYYEIFWGKEVVLIYPIITIDGLLHCNKQFS